MNRKRSAVSVRLMVDAPAPIQEILIGAIIVVAVVLDQLQHRNSD